jgi:hypothetical protein
MTPVDQADAVSGIVGSLAEFGNGVRRDHHRLENNLNRNGGGGVEGPGDFLGMFGDRLEGFWTVKVLAASDEPDFKLFKINSHSLYAGHCYMHLGGCQRRGGESNELRQLHGHM